MRAFRTLPLLVSSTLLLVGGCPHRAGTGPAGTGPAGTGPDPTAGVGARTTSAGAPSSTLPGSDPAAVLRERLAKVQACYETLLKEDAELAGRFLLTLDVDERGTVLEATLEAEADPEGEGTLQLEGCLHSSLEGARFPASAEGYLLEVPLVFAPKIVDPEPDPASEAP